MDSGDDRDAKTARETAKSAGLRYYFSGEPCSRGHLSKRQVCDRSCVECKNQNKRIARQSNPEKHRSENKRRWRIDLEKSRERSRIKNGERYRSLRNDPEFLEKIRTDSKKRYYKNLERTRENRARWSRENRHKNLEILRARGRANTQRRKALKLQSEGECTADQIEELRKRIGKRCAHCRILATKRKLTIDHIIPLARGGLHDIRNIQFLCGPCNSSKNARDPIEFAQSAGRLL